MIFFSLKLFIIWMSHIVNINRCIFFLSQIISRFLHIREEHIARTTLCTDGNPTVQSGFQSSIATVEFLHSVLLETRMFTNPSDFVFTLDEIFQKPGPTGVDMFTSIKGELPWLFVGNYHVHLKLLMVSLSTELLMNRDCPTSSLYPSKEAMKK